jgi:hypothetical protein
MERPASSHAPSTPLMGWRKIRVRQLKRFTAVRNHRAARTLLLPSIQVSVSPRDWGHTVRRICFGVRSTSTLPGSNLSSI